MAKLEAREFSAMVIYRAAKRRNHMRMDIYAIRIKNLMLIATGRKRRDCAEKWDTSASTLSQIMSKNPVRNLGDELARKIERAEGLPDGWLDQQHAEHGETGDNVRLNSTGIVPFFVSDTEVDIPQYDIRAAMGAGQVPPDYIELVRHVVVDKAHLDLFGVTYSAPENLAMVTGWGQSMAPTINHGEPVIVDRGVSHFVGDGVYVFTWDGLLYLKRLQKEPGGKIKVISDNRAHDPFHIPALDVNIHARVVMVWNASKL